MPHVKQYNMAEHKDKKIIEDHLLEDELRMELGTHRTLEKCPVCNSKLKNGKCPNECKDEWTLYPF